MNERTVLALKLVSTHILLLPLLLAVTVFLPGVAFPMLGIVQLLLLIIYQTGYWEFFGMRTRIYYSLLIEFLIVLLFILNLPLQNLFAANFIILLAFGLTGLWLLLLLVKIIIVIFKHDRSSVEIFFPLKNGRYLVTDGGNSRISRLMNYHYYSPVHRKKGTSNSMKFATDIVLLGNRWRSFLPPANEDYAIFSEKVYSPFSGIVFKVENSIDDNIPYSGNYPYNTGNTIVIKNEDNYLLIGHLKKGSILKNPGDPVESGECIAEAGNSGYTERPHIHMQLIHSVTEIYWTGMGIGLTFVHKNLYKNRVIEN